MYTLINMKRLLVLFAAASLMGAGCAGYEIVPVSPAAPAVPAATSTSDAAAPAAAPAPAPTKTIPKTAPKPVAKPAPTPAPTTPPPTTTTFTSSGLQLTVVVATYGADLSWTMYQGKDLKGYYLVKSTTDQNPYYPKEFYFRFESAAVNARAYQDRNMEKGKTTYYRVCAIRIDDTIICGNVAKGNF